MHAASIVAVSSSLFAFILSIKTFEELHYAVQLIAIRAKTTMRESEGSRRAGAAGEATVTRYFVIALRLSLQYD